MRGDSEHEATVSLEALEPAPCISAMVGSSSLFEDLFLEAHASL